MKVNPETAEQLGIKPFEAADYLHPDEDCALYLQACIEEATDDAALFFKALGDVARARGMMQLARDTGLTREGLYKALGEQGNPSFATVLKVLHALGAIASPGNESADAHQRRCANYGVCAQSLGISTGHTLTRNSSRLSKRRVNKQRKPPEEP